MYNEEQKQSFLNTIDNDNTYKTCARIFRATASLEEKFEKDICEMNIEEIITVMDLKTGTRMANTAQFMSILRIYVDWCIQNGKTTSENNFEKIEIKDVEKGRIYRSKYLKDPDEFEYMCSIVYKMDAEYNEDTEKQKELCVRLCYEGLESQEIVELKKTDVDYENGIIHSPVYENRQYSVSKKILELCKFCEEQEFVEFIGRGGVTRKERVCDNQYIIRARIGAIRGNAIDKPINKVIVSRRVKEFSDFYSDAMDHYKSITESKLRESKIFYTIYCSNNPDKYIEEILSPEIVMKDPNISSRNLYEKIRQIKNSYKMWKEAFY